MAELVSEDGNTWLVRLPKGYYFLGVTIFPLIAVGSLWLVAGLYSEEGISYLFLMLTLFFCFPLMLAYRFFRHVPYLKYDLEVSADKLVIAKSQHDISSYTWDELNLIGRISLSSIEIYKEDALLAVVSSGCHSYKQFFEIAKSAKNGKFPNKL